MDKAEFYIVHRDRYVDNEGTASFQSDHFPGLGQEAAYAKYHELLASEYSSYDPWFLVYIVRDDGIIVSADINDRRIESEDETTSSGSSAESGDGGESSGEETQP